MNGNHQLGTSYGQKLTWTLLLSNTYNIYRKHFWAFLGIGLPIALLAYVFRQCERSLVHALFNLLVAKAGMGWELTPHTYYPVIVVLGFIEGGVYWILSTILFAAIARKVVREDYDDGNIPLSDAYSYVRQKLRALFVFGIVTWVPFWLTRLLALSATWKLLDFLGVKLSPFLATIVLSLPLLIVAGLFSRLALAVPELMDKGNISVREALRSSFRNTENWEPFFIFFLLKTAVVGYGVYWVADRSFDVLWARTSMSASAYYWVTWGVYVCLFAMLESPLFIAFCVLYRETQFNQEDALTAPAIG